MNTDKYIDDLDLSRFNLFQQGNSTAKTFYYTDDLPPLEDLFPDHIYYAILHKKNQGSDVGHWVLLVRWDDLTFEYFDCLGDAAPIEVVTMLDNYSELNSQPINLIESGRQLMNRNNFICGKWVMFRIMTLPNTLPQFHKFIDMITAKKKVTADAVVNFMINIPFKFSP